VDAGDVILRHCVTAVGIGQRGGAVTTRVAGLDVGCSGPAGMIQYVGQRRSVSVLALRRPTEARAGGGIAPRDDSGCITSLRLRLTGGRRARSSRLVLLRSSNASGSRGYAVVASQA
jgi:hypothetical protein